MKNSNPLIDQGEAIKNSAGEINQYLSSIIKQDPDLFDKMQAILTFVKNNQIDYRKFNTLKLKVVPEKKFYYKFGVKHEIKMFDWEFLETLQQFFEEEQLIQLIFDFCRQDEDPQFVDYQKVIFLNEMVLYLPQIITKDKNVSEGMHAVMSTETFFDKDKF